MKKMFQNKTVLYNIIILFFLNLLWKQNYLRPGLTVYKRIYSFLNFFQINKFGVMLKGNVKNI